MRFQAAFALVLSLAAHGALALKGESGLRLGSIRKLQVMKEPGTLQVVKKDDKAPPAPKEDGGVQADGLPKTPKDDKVAKVPKDDKKVKDKKDKKDKKCKKPKKDTRRTQVMKDPKVPPGGTLVGVPTKDKLEPAQSPVMAPAMEPDAAPAGGDVLPDDTGFGDAIPVMEEPYCLHGDVTEEQCSFARNGEFPSDDKHASGILTMEISYGAIPKQEDSLDKVNRVLTTKTPPKFIGCPDERRKLQTEDEAYTETEERSEEESVSLSGLGFGDLIVTSDGTYHVVMLLCVTNRLLDLSLTSVLISRFCAQHVKMPQRV